MRVPLLLGVALLAAGCVTVGPAATTPPTDALSQVADATVVMEDLAFAADDGVVIDAVVFRPDGVAGVPIIINFSPYWSNLAPPAREGGDAFSLYLIDHFVPRGYAVALVSARGTGLSEGCFSIGGTREIDDMDQILDHFAAQPWTNGNMAAIAKSYDGTMAQGLLTRNDPHLRTIVPVSPISEFYKYNYYGGVPYDFGGLLFNTYYVAQTSLAQNVGGEAADTHTFDRTPTRFCEEAVGVQAYQYHGAATGDYSAYWQERNYTALLPDRIEASVFYIHGLQDWNVKPDHMWPWLDELYARNATVKAWLGQWAHDYPHRDDWNATLLRWFDHELKGIDNGILDEPLVQVQDTDGVWRHEARWPPVRAMPFTLYPTEGGELGADAGSGSASYVEVPSDLSFGLPPRAPGSSVLYQSAPLERALRISGMPTFTATVSSTAPRATIAVALLVDGKVVDQGFLDLAHRDGLATSEPAVPGETYQVSLPLYPQDIVVPAGATLGLLVGASEPAGALAGVTPVAAGARVTLSHGEGTALTLPVLEIDDVVIEDPQPESLGCWTC